MSEKVAVAIPTYNRLALLKECIQSILGQTFQDFSIFVFDNASTEPVESMLKEFGDERIHFVGSEKNLGPTGNINRILQYPFSSEYLIIFHSDDAMHPRMLEFEAAFLDSHKDFVFVVSDLRHASDANLHQFEDLDKKEIPSILYRGQRDFVEAVMKWLRYAFSSAMYRFAFLQGLQMDFERFSDFADLAFLTKVSEKGPCGFLHAALMNYRIHPNQDSQELKETYENGAIEFLRWYGEILPSFRYAPNFLLRTYANINKGLPDFVRFIKKCQGENVLRYRDFFFLDARGIVSLISIVFHSKKIIDVARWLRNSFQS